MDPKIWCERNDSMFGERLHMLRMEKELTMKKAGAAIGVTDGAWNKYEKNKSQPSYETLTKIADVFDVSLDYLLGRTNIRDNTMADVISRQHTFLKEFERASLVDPTALISLTESLIESARLFNIGNIDEKTFYNLLSLLDNAVMTFNKLANQKKENQSMDRWFSVYQKSMLDFISGYNQIFNYLKELPRREKVSHATNIPL